MGRHEVIKLSLTVSLLTAFMTIVTNVSGQNLTVQFHNRTGYDIDNLTVGTVLVGSIANDSTTNKITFPEFMLDSGYPYEEMEGTIKNSLMTSRDWSWCASERFPIYDGELRYDIVLKEFEGVNHLYLTRHQ